MVDHKTKETMVIEQKLYVRLYVMLWSIVYLIHFMNVTNLRVCPWWCLFWPPHISWSKQVIYLTCSSRYYICLQTQPLRYIGVFFTRIVSANKSSNWKYIRWWIWNPCEEASWIHQQYFTEIVLDDYILIHRNDYIKAREKLVLTWKLSRIHSLSCNRYFSKGFSGFWGNIIAFWLSNLDLGNHSEHNLRCMLYTMMDISAALQTCHGTQMTGPTVKKGGRLHV